MKERKNNSEAAELLGLPVETAIRWWQWYLPEGEQMLSVPKRGRKIGEKRHLGIEKAKQIQKMIVDHYPDQLKLPFTLWDRQAIRKLIKLQFGLEMPIQTFGKYLSRKGYTSQKHILNAYEQRPAEVERRMKESYSAIVAEAKAEKAAMYWEDKTCIATNCNRVRGYAPPELRRNARKEHISKMAAISNRGQTAIHALRECDERQGAYRIHETFNQGCRSQSDPDPRKQKIGSLKTG